MPQSNAHNSADITYKQSDNIPDPVTRRGIFGLIGMGAALAAAPALAARALKPEKTLAQVQAEIRAKMPPAPMLAGPIEDMSDEERFNLGRERLLWAWEAQKIMHAAVFA